MRSGRARCPPLRAVELQHPAACIGDGGASLAICPTSEETLSREAPAHPALAARPPPPKREETRECSFPGNDQASRARILTANRGGRRADFSGRLLRRNPERRWARPGRRASAGVGHTRSQRMQRRLAGRQTTPAFIRQRGRALRCRRARRGRGGGVAGDADPASAIAWGSETRAVSARLERRRCSPLSVRF